MEQYFAELVVIFMALVLVFLIRYLIKTVERIGNNAIKPNANPEEVAGKIAEHLDAALRRQDDRARKRIPTKTAAPLDEGEVKARLTEQGYEKGDIDKAYELYKNIQESE